MVEAAAAYEAALARLELSGALAALGRDPPAAAEEEARIAGLEPHGFFRALLAPDITARLRPGAPAAIEDTGAALERALRAEAARAGDVDGLKAPLWTALGDMVINASGAATTPAHVDGLPPLDIASPQARSIDPTSALCAAAPLREPMAEGDRERVVELLSWTRDAIAGVSSLALSLVKGCGLVLLGGGKSCVCDEFHAARRALWV